MNAIKIPTHLYKDQIESERLISRFLTRDDAKEWVRFIETPDAVKFIRDFGLQTPMDIAEFWINSKLERYDTSKLGLQALILKETGEFIGQSGLLIQEVDGISEVETVYHIFKEHWGKGYAPEAAKMFINFAFDNGITESVISIIDKRNMNSILAAEKNGLFLDKTTKWKDMDVFIYRINKEN